MTTKIAAIPPLDGVKDPAIKRVLQSIKDMLEIRDGQRKSQDGLDRYVTMRELPDLADYIVAGASSGAGGVVGVGGFGSIVVQGETPDLSKPPTLTGLATAVTMTSVILTWDSWTSDSRHGLTEVWRADTDNIGTAVLIGTAPGDLYVDAIGEPSKTVYYWIRAISRWEGAPPGNFSQVAGTAATTTIDPAKLMPYLVDSISESHLVGALRSRIDTIEGDVESVEVTSSTHAGQIAGLGAQHVMKVRAGGAIAGIGLAATDSGEGGVTSEVAIVSDRFYIAPPSGTSKGAKVFAHYTVPTTVNGQNVPAGTYIESAYIPYGVINRLHFDKATGNKIIAADATFGDVLADTIKVVNANIVGEIKSDNFVTGSTGWRIHKNGVAEFSNAIVRGTVYATNGEFYGTLKGGAATSYTAGDGLWAGMNGATYSFRLGTTTNYLRWTGSALEIQGTVTIRDGSGNILLSSGSGIPWSKIDARPTSLSGLNATEGAKLAGIAPGADVTSQNTAAAIAGQGAFATLSKINASNVTTYIENAAFGNAQIGGNLWSTNWSGWGGSGWLLDRNGNFYGNNIYARGDIQASSLKAGVAMVDALNIKGSAMIIPIFISHGSGAWNMPYAQGVWHHMEVWKYTLTTEITGTFRFSFGGLWSITHWTGHANWPNGTVHKMIRILINGNAVETIAQASTYGERLTDITIGDRFYTLGAGTHTVSVYMSALMADGGARFSRTAGSTTIQSHSQGSSSI